MIKMFLVAFDLSNHRYQMQAKLGEKANKEITGMKKNNQPTNKEKW
jgi:hypothetical protein